MKNFGLMDYQEYLKKHEKVQDTQTNNSMSFENFLKSKSFKDDATDIHSPQKSEGDKTKAMTTPPIKQKKQSETNLPLNHVSGSLKKIRHLIDSTFKEDAKEEKTPYNNRIPTSYLGGEEKEDRIEAENNESDSLKEKMQFNKTEFESFEKENVKNNNEIEEILNEMQIDNENNDKTRPKSKFHGLQVDTNQLETAEMLDNSGSPEEKKKKVYTSLQEKKSEFSNFLDNLGWQSKSYLKKTEKRDYNGLLFHDKQEYIKKLNANICDFTEGDGYWKQSLENFFKREENLIIPSISKTKQIESNIQTKWKEKMKQFSQNEKEKKNLVELNLQYLLRNSLTFQKNKTLL